MNQRLNAILTAVCLILASCKSIIDLSPMTVTLHPSQADSVLGASDRLGVDYSFDIQRSTAESITSVLDQGQTVPCDFVWTDNSVTLLPRKTLTPGRRYLLQVSGTVISQSGTSKIITSQVPFYDLFVGTPPLISGVAPVSGSALNPSQSLTITFTQAIDPSTLTHGLTLSPSVGFHTAWSADEKTLTLSPQTTWSSLVPLTVTFQKTLASTSGETLDAVWTSQFWVQDGQLVPQVTSVDFLSRSAYTLGTTASLTPLPETNPGWTDLVSLTFNEAIDFEDFVGQAQILPAISGHWEKLTPTQFVFIPDTGWNQAASYLLSVPAFKTPGDTVSAAAWQSTWSTLSTIPVQSVAVLATTEGITQSLTAGDSAAPTILAFGNPAQLLTLSLTFSQPITDIYKASLASSAIITPLLPLSASSATLTNITQGSSSITLNYNLAPLVAGSTAVYKLVLPGGSAASINASGSYLPESLTYLFELQG